MEPESYVQYWTELKQSIPQSSTLLMQQQFLHNYPIYVCILEMVFLL
jgi:hypothetical protein